MQSTLTVFATRDEIFDWLAYRARKFDLRFALVKYQPEFEVVRLARWQEFTQHKDSPDWREVWIDLRPLRHKCTGHIECRAKNPDRLTLQLPETCPEGLRQGYLETHSADETHLRVWAAIIRYFSKQTTPGMWVMTPTTRVREFYKHLRYSPGIAELHRQGLQLLPFVGNNRLFIEEPPADDPSMVVQ